MTKGRWVGLGVLLVVLFVGAVSGYQAWRLKGDLERAETSVKALRAALDSDDPAARNRAIVDLKRYAAAAADRSAGLWWSGLTHLPIVGDDAEGVQVLSSSLDTLAGNAIEPLAQTLDSLDQVSKNGRVDTALVTEMQDPVERASSSFTAANRAVSQLDSDGFVGPLRTKYDDYRAQVSDAAEAMASAATATRALPTMLGGEGPRDYLLIFQNNSEIRATGGMPGSWALLHAEDGKLSMEKQGTASDFTFSQKPVLPLTAEEVAVYDQPLGQYFQDPGFTPDFPRAAELWQAHWDKEFPNTQIDGVISLDPVAMSYLLEGTGPVTVDGATYTSDNVVEQLLSRPYLELEPVEQDKLFQRVARGLFDALTGDLKSPIDLIEGLSKATKERRFLVGPFNEVDAAVLSDSKVIGALSGDDGSTPHVDIGVNDSTGSKMSYYLRYGAEVESRSCSSGRQSLAGSMHLSQTISPADAAALPASITGGGLYGVEPGTQLLQVRIYGPFGGTIDSVKVDGVVTAKGNDQMIDGRPVVTLAISLETREDVVITWASKTGENQTGDVVLQQTPGVMPGSKSSTAPSSC